MNDEVEAGYCGKCNGYGELHRFFSTNWWLCDGCWEYWLRESWQAITAAENSNRYVVALRDDLIQRLEEWHPAHRPMTRAELRW